MTEAERPIDIEALLSRMQPPVVPEETAAASPGLMDEIEQWSRTYAVIRNRRLQSRACRKSSA